MKKELLRLAFLMAMTLSSNLQVGADDVTFTSSNLPIVLIQTEQAINAETKVKGIQQQQWRWGGQQNVEAPITWTIYYPKKKDLQPEQHAYIQNYVDSVELTIQGPDFADPDQGYAQFIDVTSFVDYFIHTEMSLNADGFKRSAYYYNVSSTNSKQRRLILRTHFIYCF